MFLYCLLDTRLFLKFLDCFKMLLYGKYNIYVLLNFVLNLRSNNYCNCILVKSTTIIMKRMFNVIIIKRVAWWCFKIKSVVLCLFHVVEMSMSGLFVFFLCFVCKIWAILCRTWYITFWISGMNTCVACSKLISILIIWITT